jgi:hypothetical protein
MKLRAGRRNCNIWGGQGVGLFLILIVILIFFDSATQRRKRLRLGLRLRLRKETRSQITVSNSPRLDINRVRIRTMKNIVYFDLETQKSADEVGGWDRIRDMRMSVGVTYSTARGGYRIYAEGEVNALIEELRRADLVVGFNNLRFDYEVLAGHNDSSMSNRCRRWICWWICKRRCNTGSRWTPSPRPRWGWKRPAKDCRPSGGTKRASLLEIAEYCCYDVKITRLVHEYGVSHKQLHYLNRFGKKLTVPVAWAKVA